MTRRARLLVLAGVVTAGLALARFCLDIKCAPPPPPTATDRAERTRQAILLLRGVTETHRLPVVATEPDTRFDEGLRDVLEPKREVPLPSGGPRPSCKCPLGDPLCSCL